MYFAKHVRELTLAESAMLAAVPQSPALNPIDNYPLARERQAKVLDLMVEQGMISREQADAAYAAELDIQQPEQRFDLLAPHFSVAARKQLEEMFGPERVYRGGLTVYTTLDYDLHLQVECAARSQLARLSGQPAGTIVPAADGSECRAAEYLTPLPAGFEWGQGNTVAEQAQWLARAAQLSASSGRVRLMIIWNVDFTTYGADPAAGYAIIRPGGGCPACAALDAVMP